LSDYPRIASVLTVFSPSSAVVSAYLMSLCSLVPDTRLLG